MVCAAFKGTLKIKSLVKYWLKYIIANFEHWQMSRMLWNPWMNNLISWELRKGWRRIFLRKILSDQKTRRTYLAKVEYERLKNILQCCVFIYPFLHQSSRNHYLGEYLYGANTWRFSGKPYLQQFNHYLPYIYYIVFLKGGLTLMFTSEFTWFHMQLNYFFCLVNTIVQLQWLLTTFYFICFFSPALP